MTYQIIIYHDPDKKEAAERKAKKYKGFEVVKKDNCIELSKKLKDENKRYK